MFLKELKELQGLGKAYVQILDGEFVNDAAFAFYHGCKLLNLEVEKFEEHITDNSKQVGFNDLELQKDFVVNAGVPMMLETFKRLGIETPKPLDIPEEIKHFCKREVRVTTLKELYNLCIFGEKVLWKGSDELEREDQKFPIFVKPADQGKLFAGQVISCKEELEMLQYVDEENGWETNVFSSDVVNIVSEFRCFVIKGEIYDCRKYKGEFNAVPDFDVIEKCVKEYTNSPVAYGIDFGVTDKGETILIEANDAYSLGPYGFDAYNYTRMVILRWKEIMGI